jgi:hypothetical protein
LLTLAAEVGMHPEITSPDELSFVARDREGARCDWQPARDASSPEAGLRRGLVYVQYEIAQLARADEYDAYTALTQALTAATWDGQRAEEVGFADGVARLALIGLRALASPRKLPFDTQFDPRQAQWCALHARLELMEAQLRALKITPWRNRAQAPGMLR